jgi:hypothetical protein
MAISKRHSLVRICPHLPPRLASAYGNAMMIIPPFVSGLAFAAFLLASHAQAEETYDCKKPENQTVVATLKPIIEKAKLCKGLRKKVNAGLFKVKIEVDQTVLVRVDSLAFCTSADKSRIEATIHVECESPDDADVDITLAETFDVMMMVDNKTCQIVDFAVEPDGDIGELIAENTDFEDKVRKGAQKQVNKLCDPAS